jgi:hypothetical protein
MATPAAAIALNLARKGGMNQSGRGENRKRRAHRERAAHVGAAPPQKMAGQKYWIAASATRRDWPVASRRSSSR